MHLSRRDQFPHGATRRLSEAKDRIDSLPPDKRGAPGFAQRVLVSSLIGGWYASGGIESKPRRVATKVGILGSAFAVIWMTTESSEDSADTDNNSLEAAVSEDPGLEAAEGAGTSPSESELPQATPSKIDENRAPSPWGWARLGLAISAVVGYFVGSFYFSRFIRRKALAFIRAHITESRPWTVYGILVGIVCFALSFNEDKRTANLDARLKALA
ncbi:hypothetical protein Q0N40_10575 [Corynebacterium pseudokroppenstedtii]|uniref:DUF1206 domain-containing protein n=1 Tax=Corynebacterium pseudokroppenstedtii TaxID=2804917 RepID=A0AAU0Q0E6_9CORY|nr:hypothetical protein [Corynebacterium pseudokroppenstedtii]MBY0790497.1 hypothetical protein [Corynebacterium pseudokroppenstedtii]MCF6792960.1 hypothetical protein [Corynebacterium pseudokroppenstedtii]MCF8702245.1 hypothetical protein [Corynebacterium pseudokroppenstedtii]MCG2635612.1 hypothetical protein [Corynebacterium pseudokroppenstedtii]